MSISSSQDSSCPNVPPEDGYYVYQHGSHADGTFIRVYVPEAAENSETKLKVILYLHGFALCMPSFYEEHLVQLVKKGYIVFFPDFQRSFYPNTPPQAPTPTRPTLKHLQIWRSLGKELSAISEEDSLPTHKINSLFRDEGSDADLESGMSEFSVSAAKLKLVVLPILIILTILSVLSWFQREYGKNLIHLLSTVALSLAYKPTEWLDEAISLTEDAWNDLRQQERYSHWQEEKLDAFAFGHSLGGLLALSLPWHLKDKPNHPFFPQKIVTADPAANTEMGIPKCAIWILKLFGSPFTEEPILIKNTGESLTEPVAILHGGADKLVPPSQWVAASGDKGSNYDAIASKEKAIYFSYSNPDKQPPLKAFHNQAVTCTEYYGDALFKNFGGVKKGANAYNCQYIWPGVDKIFNGTATPENLRSHLKTDDFQVETTPPQDSGKLWKRLAWILGAILLLRLGYWIYGIV
ncbi:hypothetical protein [Roseofilum sp. Guam]|uniref:hypothetical protein n=1 Tax=Roseofilum sp. Guam TaxID=2821502 RepID=UPI001B055EAA|nr:hypothetical protein [Roseofilum sp. Guam]MBP0027987.1 hypothetical protein [Roseofilum sp. Guam]